MRTRWIYCVCRHSEGEHPRRGLRPNACLTCRDAYGALSCLRYVPSRRVSRTEWFVKTLNGLAHPVDPFTHEGD